MSGIDTIVGGNTPIVSDIGSGNPLPNGAVLGLVWDGSTYQPANRQSDITTQKFFTGPIDPQTVPGVVLATYDQWIPE